MVELLIVVTILGLLFILTAVNAPSQIKKARDARRKADLQEIKVAFYDYFFDYGCFPEELPECGKDFGSEGEPYLRDFPCDPLGNPYVYVITKKGGGKCSQWFRIFTNLEVTADPIIEKIHCQDGCGPDKTDCNYNYGVASTNTQIYRNCADAYACNPGGICEKFEDPLISGCPKTYGGDSDCSDECSDPENRCKNSSGKQTPIE